MCGLCLLHGVIVHDESRNHDSSPGYARWEPALEILKKRYARGEINKEEYDE